jgi:soluble lytic murein transglycosylase-like protein
MRCAMRCVVRCLSVTVKLVTFSVPIAAVVFVCSEQASAHARHHSYHHGYGQRFHVASRHYLLMYANDFPSNSFGSRSGYASQNFYAPFAASRNSLSGYTYANASRYDAPRYDNVSAMAASQAGTAGLPASLVERVIHRESGGNPRAVHAGNYGLMQIRLGTARAMGYTGSAAGLLDPQTNMTYALRYLAGAYRAAGGNESRAIALYSRGYYYQAKAQGFSPYACATNSAPGWGSGNYGASVQPAYQTSAWPTEQYGLRHRRHYHA